MLNFCDGVMLRRSRIGIRSRKAASLICRVLRLEGDEMETVEVTMVGSGAIGVDDVMGSGAGVDGMAGFIESGVGWNGCAGIGGMEFDSGAIGCSGVGISKFGISAGLKGVIGSGVGGVMATCGSGNGPIDSSSSPVSPSGTEDGAATGSEKTGSVLVLLVMSSIAFCRSLSTI